MDFHNSNPESPPPEETLPMIEESEMEKSLLDISNSIKMSPEYEKEDARVETPVRVSVIKHTKESSYRREKIHLHNLRQTICALRSSLEAHEAT